MAVTQENATVCQKCGKLVGDSNFCPYCGEAVTQSDLPTEALSPVAAPEAPTPPPSKTVWQRLPLWAKILPFVLIVLIAFAPVIADSISKAQRKAAREAAEQASIEERQAVWAEYATRWNSYADQGETAPTKGTQYPFQMAEGWQNAVAFGSGQVSIDLESHSSPDFGTVTYESSSGYSETDIYALSYIFAGEEHADELTQEFRTEIPLYIPEAINSVQIILSGNESETFAPSLEFDYRYSTAVTADSGPFGLRSRITLDDFIDNYNNYVHEDNADDDTGTMDALMGYQKSSFEYKGINEFGYDGYMYIRSHYTSVPYVIGLNLSNGYIVEANFRFDMQTYARSNANQQSSTRRTYQRVLSAASGLPSNTVSDMLSEGTSNNKNVYRDGFGLICGTTYVGNSPYLTLALVSATETAWEKMQNGTLFASDGSSNQTVSSPEPNASDPSASSGLSLPYVIRATEEMPIYSGPGVNYDYNGSMPPGAYTIVEESEGEGADLWGRLKSGAGWIALDNVS